MAWLLKKTAKGRPFARQKHIPYQPEGNEPGAHHRTSRHLYILDQASPHDSQVRCAEWCGYADSEVWFSS